MKAGLEFMYFKKTREGCSSVFFERARKLLYRVCSHSLHFWQVCFFQFFPDFYCLINYDVKIIHTKWKLNLLVYEQLSHRLFFGFVRHVDYFG